MLLGEICAQRLGLKPGQSVTLGGKAYRVRGIFRSGSRTFDGGVLGRLEDVQALFAQPGVEPYVSMGVMSSRPGQSSDQLIAAVRERHPMLRAIHGGQALALTGPSGCGKGTLLSLIGLSARALINRPALILAGEPTGNLDSHSGAQVVALLLQHAREYGALVLVATHNPEIAATLDARIALLDGRVVGADGTAGAEGAAARSLRRPVPSFVAEPLSAAR